MRLLPQGVEYVYFIDEIFLPDMPLLAGLAERKIKIGVQTRIDLWSEEAHSGAGQGGLRFNRGRRREYHRGRSRLPG